MAVQVRALFPTDRADTPADLHTDVALFLSVGQQPLSSTAEVDGEQGMGHRTHHSRSRLLRPPHAASHPNRRAVLPPQPRHAAHEREQAIHGLIVFERLCGAVGLWIRRPGIRYSSRRLAADLVGFRNAQAPLACVGLSRDANGRTFHLKGAVPCALCFEQSSGAAHVSKATLHGRAHVLDSKRLFTFAGETKAFEHRLPTAGQKQIVAVMAVFHAKQESSALGKTVLKEGPPLRRSFREDGLLRADRRARNFSCSDIWLCFRTQFIHHVGRPLGHAACNAQHALTVLLFDHCRTQEFEPGRHPFDRQIEEPRVVGWSHRCAKTQRDAFGLAPRQR